MPRYQTVEVLPDGAVRSPGGTVFRRTSVRVKRKNGRALVVAGANVVTDVYPDGLTWFDGSHAVSVWNEIEPRLVTGTPPQRWTFSGPDGCGSPSPEPSFSTSKVTTNATED